MTWQKGILLVSMFDSRRTWLCLTKVMKWNQGAHTQKHTRTTYPNKEQRTVSTQLPAQALPFDFLMVILALIHALSLVLLTMDSTTTDAYCDRNSPVCCQYLCIPCHVKELLLFIQLLGNEKIAKPSLLHHQPGAWTRTKMTGTRRRTYQAAHAMPSRHARAIAIRSRLDLIDSNMLKCI